MMARANYLIDKELFDYMLQISVKEPAGLAEVRAHTQTMRGWGKILTAECGHLLRFLLKLTGSRRCLDVGTFTGFSALCMAIAVPEGGEVHTCEADEARLCLAQENFKRLPEGQRIRSYLGPAADTMRTMLDTHGPGYFDCIFIDADKQNNETYYQHALQLIKDDGLIIVDNVFWYKQILDNECVDEATQATRLFNLQRSTIADDQMCMMPLGDGLMLIRATATLKKAQAVELKI